MAHSISYRSCRLTTAYVVRAQQRSGRSAATGISARCLMRASKFCWRGQSSRRRPRRAWRCASWHQRCSIYWGATSMMKAKDVIRIWAKTHCRNASMRPQLTYAATTRLDLASEFHYQSNAFARQTNKHEQSGPGFAARSRKKRRTQIGETMTAMLPAIAEGIVGRSTIRSRCRR